MSVAYPLITYKEGKTYVGFFLDLPSGLFDAESLEELYDVAYDILIDLKEDPDCADCFKEPTPIENIDPYLEARKVTKAVTPEDCGKKVIALIEE